jgi:hypothetical protein
MKKSAFLAKKTLILLLTFILVAGPLFIADQVHAAGLRFTSISSQLYSSLALDSNQEIWAWGSNDSGQFGDGTTDAAYSFVPKKIEVLDGGTPVKFQEAKMGWGFSLALDTAGQLWSTGVDSNGELGNGASGPTISWKKLTIMDGATLVTFTTIAATRATSFALDSEGALWSWGVRSNTTDPQVPMKKDINDNATPVSFTELKGDGLSVLAIDSFNHLWNIFKANTVPTKLSPMDGGVEAKFQSISVGYGAGGIGAYYLNLALDENGDIWTWGEDEKGQLGDGATNTSERAEPGKIIVTDSGNQVKFDQISAGQRHALALDESGNMWAWGNNETGQLGNNSTNDSSVPIKVTVVDGNGVPFQFSSVEAGYGSSYGLDANGQIWAWGEGLQPVPKKLKFAPSVSLSATKTSLAYGESVTLRASVTGVLAAPTGNVNFMDGSTSLGSIPLTGGTAELVVPSLSSGSHQLTASYVGNDEYVTLTSNQVTVSAAANPAKAITAFSFASPAATGTVNEASKTIAVTVPYGTNVTALAPTIVHSGASISPNSGVAQNFTNPVTYTVRAADNSTQSYTVTVTVAANPAKAITAFSFASPAATGTVNEASKTIAVTVPYGTNVTALAPTIVHTGASISPNSGVAQNFTTPVTYTVTAADSTTQSYTVTVTVAANPAKAITAFSFASPAATGTVNEASKTIAVTVPYETDVTALAPTIVHTGASISPNNGTAQDFTDPVTYTVTAADSTTQSYTVTVTVAANPAKAITAFSFADPAATGTVNETDKTIAITVPYETDVTALAPTIVHSGASISPNNEVAQDFTDPVTYTVTAADSTTQSYTVTVTVAANPAKAITAFSFASPAAVGIINETDKSIAISVPYGTNVTALAPTIVHSGATISPDSGAAEDFTAPVTYTVTAADNTTQSYIVTVTVLPPVIVPSSPSGTDNGTVKTVADIWLNSKVISSGAITSEDGNKRLTISVNRSALDPLLAAAGKGAVLTFQAKETFGTVVASLDGELLRNLQQNQARIELRTGQAAYVLPAHQLNIDELISQLGGSAALKDLKIELGIELLGELAEAAVIQDGGTTTPLTAQIAFTLQAKHGETLLNITKLNAQAEHRLVIPDRIDSTMAPTALIVQADGSYRPLPTKFLAVEGKRYAKVNSLSSNTYVVVTHSTTFSDVANHWSAQAINEMSARMIVKGTGDGQYRPSQMITRAEFAAVLVRGLGLPRTTGDTSFSDVTARDWYSDAVQTAASNQLIAGYEDGTFRPNDTITREQAMVIIARAMTLTGLEATLPSIAVDETLLPYTDADSASAWALNGIARNLQAGVVYGKSHDTLAPLESVTRAEVAVIIRRLLQQSDLI